jgi:hypothetical protein
MIPITGDIISWIKMLPMAAMTGPVPHFDPDDKIYGGIMTAKLMDRITPNNIVSNMIPPIGKLMCPLTLNVDSII